MRTLRYMFVRPGFLALEFSRNHRADYITPIRLYLFSSILCFFVLSTQTDLKPGFNLRNPPPKVHAPVDESVRSRYEAEAMLVESLLGSSEVDPLLRVLSRNEDSFTRRHLDQLLGYLQSTSPSQVSTTEKLHLSDLISLLDLSAEELERIELNREVDESTYLRRVAEHFEQPVVRRAGFILSAPQREAARTLLTSSIDAIFGDEVATRLELFILQVLIDVLASPSKVLEEFIDNLPIAMFALLPVMTLLHYLLYIRQRIFLAHHLIFSIHLHVIAFIVFAVLMLLPEPEAEQTIVGMVVNAFSTVLYFALIGHSFLAFRKFYQQGRFVTFVKFSVLGALYLAMLVSSILLVGLYTAVTF